ncbi:MAG: hypothetical protein GKS00_15595 [Alphaproteobacteria bacterium]|nr:hypothetical protein [Alphaproteobacteria bacterium]
MSSNSKLKFFYHSEKWKLFAVVMLGLISLAIFQTNNRYVVAETNILPNLDFRQQGSHWIGTRNGIKLRRTPAPVLEFSNEGRRQTMVTQVLRNPHRFENVHVSVDIRIDKVVPGPIWWQQAGILLLAFDRRGARMTHWPSEVVLISGTHPWQQYEAIIPVSANIARFQLFLVHGGKAGLMQVKNIRVDAVDEAFWFVAAKPLLIAFWVVAAFWVLIPLLIERRKTLSAYLALFVFLITLAGALTPQPLLSESSRPVSDKLTRFIAPTEKTADRKKAPARQSVKERPLLEAPNETMTSASRVKTRPVTLASAITGDSGQYTAHFFSHLLLGFLVSLVFFEVAWWRLLGYLLLAATATELLQIFVITRSAGIADGMANVAGVIAGLALCLGWQAARHRMTFRKSP